LQVLQRREAYRQAFLDFDPRKVAQLDPERLLVAPGLIRNRLKLQSAVDNARRVLELGSLDVFVWSFVPNGHPIQHAFTYQQEVPGHTPESDALSKALRARGFRFVGSTICYAFMQAVGMVNDHLVTCFRYSELRQAEGKPRRPGSRPRRRAG
jgi:DNA-3-methyladenine glycosylase I